MADSSSRAQRGYGNRPRRGCATAVACWTLACGLAVAAEAPVFDDVERQPLFAATRRLAEALDGAGAPLPEGARQGIAAARGLADDAAAVRAVQKALDPLCIAVVTINPESRVKVVDGPAAKMLVQQGWRTFLVKVRNDAGITPPLRVDSPNALPMVQQGRYPRQRPRTDEKLVGPEDLPDRFLDLVVPAREPLTPTLTGLAVEYRPVEIFSRDAGMREATLTFDIGAGTQDVGLRSELPVLFRCAPAVRVKLGVKDCDGRPTMAGITIRDGEGRVYPLPSRRLAPDFFFHDQVYRGDGEHVMLPAGDYTFTIGRGPEYRERTHQVTVPDGAEHEVDFTLERWIHAAARGWYSGDHHVHAAGCSHYDSPTEGVGPEAMMRHVRGEDLNVGCVLTWGPCWYTQKRFFDGRVSGLSSRDALLRYDVEVSGFPSSHCGHLCLLRLTEDDYPGTERLEDWPSWTLPVLRWAKEQGAVVGYSHSGLGLAPPDVMPDGSRAFPDGTWGRSTKRDVLSREWTGRAATQLPDDAMPRFDGIGANEYIVAAAHGLCDFISVADTPAAWELNIWYHTLNCGLTTRISGETDFPCIYDERVGLGRVYVGLDPQGDLTYDAWVDGLRDGRSYCGDGRSHLLDFHVDGTAVGRRRADGLASRLDLAAAGTVTVAFDAAARLEDSPTPETEAIRRSRPDTRPFWDVERCRIGDTRRVPVEIVVNGRVAATRELVADGHVESFKVPVEMTRSGWVAVRILPSCHTNPVFVHVGGRPIRASRGSAAWCQRAVDVCWEAKQKQISAAEQPAARAAYEEAKAVYGRILAECPEKE